MDTLDSAVDGSVDKSPSVAIVVSQQQQMQQQQKQQQQKSLTDALNDIIPDVFENLDTQPSIDHELIHSDLFKTAESLISSTIFSMCIDNFASEFNRWDSILQITLVGVCVRSIQVQERGERKMSKKVYFNFRVIKQSVKVHLTPPAVTEFVKTSDGQTP
jgi:hypothetical protein